MRVKREGKRRQQKIDSINEWLQQSKFFIKIFHYDIQAGLLFIPRPRPSPLAAAVLVLFMQVLALLVAAVVVPNDKPLVLSLTQVVPKEKNC